MPRHRPPYAGLEGTGVHRDRQRLVPALPPQQATPPCQIDVLLVPEVRLVEILIEDLNVVQRRSAVDRRRPVRSEDLLRLLVLAAILLAMTPQVLPPPAVDKQTGRVQDPRFAFRRGAPELARG